MKVLIVGGVAGGASAAARLRRLDETAEIIIFERGGEVSYANCGLPYYIGGIISDQDALLLQTPESFWQRFHVDVRTHSQVVKINRAPKTVQVVKTDTGETYEVSYDKLLLAPGAEAFAPPVSGSRLPGVYYLRTFEDTLRIRRIAGQQSCRRAVVIGGGFIGLEMVENLRSIGIDVTLIEGTDQIFPPFDREMAVIAMQEVQKNGVHIALSTPVEEIIQEDGAYRVKCKDAQTFECDFAIMSVGVRPESQLAADAGLSCNTRGGIVVDDHMQTEDNCIFATGDAVQVQNLISDSPVMLPLAGPANKQGRIVAANMVCGTSGERFDGVIGTSVAKVFEQTVACTGLNEKSLKSLGIPYEKVYLSPLHHASYYPGASPIMMKLIFSPDGTVLGCQCVGLEGVEKRVDVVASAIHFKGTVSDLARLELCYAPPYSSAKDPVNYAGFIAENVLAGRSPIRHWHDLAKLDRSTVVLIDVRTAEEHAQGHLPGSMNIPVDELRNRMAEIPTEKDIWIYCEVGLRGYIAQRILMQRRPQQHCYNLSGGYRLLTAAGLI